MRCHSTSAAPQKLAFTSNLNQHQQRKRVNAIYVLAYSINTTFFAISTHPQHQRPALLQAMACWSRSRITSWRGPLLAGERVCASRVLSLHLVLRLEISKFIACVLSGVGLRVLVSNICIPVGECVPAHGTHPSRG